MNTKATAAIRAAHTIRRENLFGLIGEGRRFATQAELATALDVTESYLSQMHGAKPHRRISEVSARKFEHKLGLKTGVLDAEA